MSLRASARLASVACSGAMYQGVPMAVPVRVRAVSSASTRRASPRSASLATPSLVTMMLAGLMSRWMMPFSWA